jgi:hypothetical protein
MPGAIGQFSTRMAAPSRARSLRQEPLPTSPTASLDPHRRIPNRWGFGFSVNQTRRPIRDPRSRQPNPIPISRLLTRK